MEALLRNLPLFLVSTACLLAASVSSDAAVSRQPANMMCAGIPTYPAGLRITFGPSDTSGSHGGFEGVVLVSDDSRDGDSSATMVALEGVVGIHYFSYMTLTSSGGYKGVYTHFDTLNNSDQKFNVVCKVISWQR